MTGAAPLSRLAEQTFAHALIETSRAMAHMNASISLAIAVTTTLPFFPREVSRRNRLHNRTWAFQPIP